MKSLFSLLFAFLMLGSSTLLAQAPLVAITVDTISLCYPADSVQLQSTILPGSGPGPYTYSWSPTTGLSDPTSPNPWVNSPGISGYALVVSNAFGSSIDSVFVINGQFVVDLGPDIVTCDTVFLDATVSGGNYSYQWWSGSTSPMLVAGLNNAGYGAFSVTVIDNVSGCVAADTILVTEASVMSATIDGGPDTTGCEGMTLEVLNPDPNWLFSWNDGSILSSTTALATGTYYVDISDPTTGCATSDTIEAVLDPAPIAIITDSVVDCNQVYLSSDGSVGTDYIWDLGDGNTAIGPSLIHTYAIDGSFDIVLEVSNLCGVALDTVGGFFSPYCVWPGDADDDGIANNLDILALGQSYSSTGTPRPNASLIWNGEAAYDWFNNLSSGVNYTFSDTDGNGIVNDDDTLAIFQNYGLTHSKHSGSGMMGDPLLYLDMSVLNGNTVGVGDTVSIPIMLGVDTLPVNDLYGIAFSLTYDSSLVQSGSVSISANTSWLGSNLLKMHKELPAQNMVDVGMTRTDQIEQSGFGQLGSFTFVMVDDIAKKDIKDSMMLGFSGIQLQRLDGSIIPVNALESQLVVEQETSTGITPRLDWDVQIYPNPSQGQMTIEIPASRNAELEIYDMLGRSVLRSRLQQQKTQLDLSALKDGIYLLRLNSPEGQWNQKIQIGS
ncbi:MAG: T9SS type A sorting domain-containing protein [Bacteroidota bacterium]